MATRLSFWFLCALFLLACGGESKKPDVASIPNPRTTHAGWVSDPSNALGTERADIEQTLEALNRETQAQVALAVLPSIGDNDPKEFAVALFKHWGIGRREQDDGVLVLHVLDVRRVEIEVGYGLEGALPDVKCAWLLDEVAIPKFREDQLGAGHLGLVRGIAYAVRDPAAMREALLQAAGVAQPVQGAPATLPLAATAEPAPGPQGIPFERMLEDAGPGLVFAWGFAFVLYFVRKAAHKSLYKNPKRRPDGLFGVFLGALTAIAIVFFLAAWLTENTWLAWLGTLSLGALGARFVSSSIRDFREARARYEPRLCEPCNRPMQLVSDDKDERYLSPGQIAEERVRSADYFVWRCSCGNTLIERYEDENDHKQCKACGFHTDVEKSRTVVREATLQSEGRLDIHYVCANCGEQRVEQQVIPKREPAGSGSSGGGGGGGSRSSSSSSSFGGGRSGGGGAGRSY